MGAVERAQIHHDDGIALHLDGGVCAGEHVVVVVDDDRLGVTLLDQLVPLRSAAQDDVPGDRDGVAVVEGQTVPVVGFGGPISMWKATSLPRPYNTPALTSNR